MYSDTKSPGKAIWCSLKLGLCRSVPCSCQFTLAFTSHHWGDLMHCSPCTWHITCQGDKLSGLLAEGRQYYPQMCPVSFLFMNAWRAARPGNKTHWSDVGLRLCQRRRLWASLKPIFVFAGRWALSFKSAGLCHAGYPFIKDDLSI